MLVISEQESAFVCLSTGDLYGFTYENSRMESGGESHKGLHFQMGFKGNSRKSCSSRQGYHSYKLFVIRVLIA